MKDHTLPLVALSNQRAADICNRISARTATRAEVIELAGYVTNEIDQLVQVPGMIEEHGQGLATAALAVTTLAIAYFGGPKS